MLEVKNLSLGYGKQTLIKGLNFNVKKGDFLCIVGANGSGKSTLIKTILGLIKPKSGKVQFRDGLLTSDIGYLPQENHLELNFPATGLEIVSSGLLGKMNHRPFFNQADHKTIDQIFKKLKISQLKHRSFSELSGGERQKILLARALVATSKLLILDEPSNNLDQDTKTGFYELLKNLNQQGITIIMITHDLDHDNLVGDKILSIKEGEYFFGKTSDYVEKIHSTPYFKERIINKKIKERHV